ncbi:MAG: hypothetical protein KDD82_30090 [Planctomycetes bacterium]|nr:hypothetical protein [Planctomycetota bacterium]
MKSTLLLLACALALASGSAGPLLAQEGGATPAGTPPAEGPPGPEAQDPPPAPAEEPQAPPADPFRTPRAWGDARGRVDGTPQARRAVKLAVRGTLTVRDKAPAALLEVDGAVSLVRVGDRVTAQGPAQRLVSVEVLRIARGRVDVRVDGLELEVR